MAEREKILEVRDLSISFKTTAGSVNAIRGVNLDLYRGETVAIVGESGSGKSVTAKAAMGILAKNGQVNSGSIQFTYTREDGEKVSCDILKMQKKEIREHINGKRIAMVFQDPMTSLNPLMTIGKQIMEGMIWHYKTPKEEAYKKAVKLLELVGITDAEKRMKNYPHQLSGGMRQRAALIRTLALEPKLLLLDEPFSALDSQTRLSVSEDIYGILRRENKSAVLVTHDISEAISFCDRVIVLTKRPGTIKKLVPIHLTLKEKTPLKARNAPEFRNYFNELWGELHEEK